MNEINLTQTEYPLNFRMGSRIIFAKQFSLSCHFANPFVLEENDEKICSAGKYFDNQDGDGFYFASIPISDPFPKISSDGKLIRYLVKMHKQSYIDLRQDFDNYMSGFSSKTRSTLKRKVRKFEKVSGGEIHWKVYKTQKEIKEFYPMARNVSKETYQEKELGMGLPSDDKYYQEMLEEAEKGNIRGYLLFLDDKPVSYLYCPSHGRTIDYEFLGYLPEVAKYSAGTVLQMLALEQIFKEEDADIFDFKEGDTPHKNLFSSGALECANIMFLNNSMANRFWIRVHLYNSSFQAWMISTLDKIGLKEKIRKILR